jgi:hypothetical protein
MDGAGTQRTLGRTQQRQRAVSTRSQQTAQQHSVKGAGERVQNLGAGERYLPATAQSHSPAPAIACVMLQSDSQAHYGWDIVNRDDMLILCI